MSQSVDYAELAEVLAQLGCSREPAEYHGALCGALCVQPADEIDLAHVVAADEGEAISLRHAPGQRALERLRDESAEALESAEATFAPLLPQDDAALAERARALAAWCEGFLYGLSSRGTLDLKAVSPEVREMVDDLVQFSQAGADEAEDPEIEENAYAELVEYVRVGAQLVFMELRPREPEPDNGGEAPNQVLH